MELQDFGGFGGKFIYSGLQWVTMGYNGLHWVIMGYNGFGVWTFGDSEFSFFDELCVS